ncbi:putative transcription factor C3H family [Lupinus albus]|uniref:Putative transcription factor C3H family n=1 Tax=Lupinus albus TaxID=3870 RepID=A0A6A4PCT0_LUPAL|nr:putative transcription factor C3H family [Lupinus albus]
MKRARKSNTVSWANGANLCQDYCPSKLGQKSDSKESSECSLAPQIKWECPSKFIFNPNMFLAAGEESCEKLNQELRESTVYESFYPDISTIPPNPTVSLFVEEEYYDDEATPIIPIEEQEDSMDEPETAATIVSSSFLSKALAIPTYGLQNIVPSSIPFSTPQIDATTTTISRTCLTSSSGLRPTILPLFLPNPTHYDEGESTVSRSIFPFSRSMSRPETQTMLFLPAPMAPNMQRPIQPYGLNVHTPQHNTFLPYGVNGASSNLFPLPSTIVNMNAPLKQLNTTGSAFAIRDENYCKDLIRKYGRDKKRSMIRTNHSSFQHLSQNKQREVKQKIQKPCKYFRRISGCRNGSNCTYLHI